MKTKCEVINGAWFICDGAYRLWGGVNPCNKFEAFPATFIMVKGRREIINHCPFCGVVVAGDSVNPHYLKSGCVGTSDLGIIVKAARSAFNKILCADEVQFSPDNKAWEPLTKLGAALQSPIPGRARLSQVGITLDFVNLAEVHSPDFNWWDRWRIALYVNDHRGLNRLIIKVQEYILDKIDRGHPGRFNRLRNWISKQVRKIRGLFLQKER